jgi:OFA family oxalate/formate antiporter-like MFS transporter
MNAPIPRWLIARLPFHYGWVILACVCCAGVARQGGAVATLSVFVSPMTAEFGWSRTAISGAVSLGGVLAAIVSPYLGRYLDKAGARLVLCAAILGTAAATALLCLTTALPMFYLLFCVARLNFAGPFDLGIYGAVNNWFVTRRALATSIATLGGMVGLMCMPLVAQAAMTTEGWRSGWLAVGATALVVGFLPVWLLLVRAPEDVGLNPDGHITQAGPVTDVSFTRAQALRTPAFWFLSLFTLLVYPVQAGVSLHQAPFLTERGLSPAVAATVVSSFSVLSGVATLCFGLMPRWVPIRLRLGLVGILLCLGTTLMLSVYTAAQAYTAAAFFGLGIGGLLTMLPIAWADYYGRRSYGAIRGLALTVQVLAQAAGPMLSGVLRDATGTYDVSLTVCAVLAGLGIVAAGLAKAPVYR